MGLMATATVGEESWVNLAQPIMVHAGNAFIVVPDPSLIPGDQGGSP
jgi:hypothetical protein